MGNLTKDGQLSIIRQPAAPLLRRIRQYIVLVKKGFEKTPIFPPRQTYTKNDKVIQGDPFEYINTNLSSYLAMHYE